MKIKVLAGIIIGLLLLTLPVFASGTDNSSDFTSKSNVTLSILGNANEDKTIDLEDVKYTENIILGSGNQTQFADATGDNSADMLDVTKIELIRRRRTACL